MLILIAAALAMVLFDLVVLLWGVDSREGSQNPDWGRPERIGPTLAPVPVSKRRKLDR